MYIAESEEELATLSWLIAGFVVLFAVALCVGSVLAVSVYEWQQHKKKLTSEQLIIIFIFKVEHCIDVHIVLL